MCPDCTASISQTCRHPLLPPHLFGAVPQSSLNCCLPAYSPHLPPIKLNSQLSHCAFLFSVDNGMNKVKKKIFLTDTITAQLGWLLNCGYGSPFQRLQRRNLHSEWSVQRTLKLTRQWQPPCFNNHNIVFHRERHLFSNFSVILEIRSNPHSRS